LQEHHDFLKVHFLQLIGPFHKESYTDIKMEF